jgi:sulfopyruvate decarboxylase TPP-binding subunit
VNKQIKKKEEVILLSLREFLKEQIENDLPFEKFVERVLRCEYSL